MNTHWTKAGHIFETRWHLFIEVGFEILKLLAFTIALALPFTTEAETVSTEMLLGIEAEDRGDAPDAIANFLIVALKGEQVGATKGEVAEASYRLFDLSFRSGGVIDFETAVRFLEYAADGGNPAAQNHLGFLITRIYNGTAEQSLIDTIGARYDLKDSIRLKEAAANSDYYPAVIQLSEDYRRGRNGALLDPVHAEELAKNGIELAVAAAKTGDPNAAVDLAAYANTGTGMPISKEKSAAFAKIANQLFEERALSGSVEARRKLMYRLMDGEGGRTSPQKHRGAEYWALEWLKGDSSYNSVTYVAGFYSDGKIGAGSKVMAHALYNYASTMGVSSYAEKERDSLAIIMTEDQLIRANSLARLCVEATLRGCLSNLDTATYR